MYLSSKCTNTHFKSVWDINGARAAHECNERKFYVSKFTHIKLYHIMSVQFSAIDRVFVPNMTHVRWMQCIALHIWKTEQTFEYINELKRLTMNAYIRSNAYIVSFIIVGNRQSTHDMCSIDLVRVCEWIWIKFKLNMVIRWLRCLAA